MRFCVADVFSVRVLLIQAVDNERNSQLPPIWSDGTDPNERNVRTGCRLV